MSYKWNRDTLLRIKSVYAANREAALLTSAVLTFQRG
jgi:hypothetical protein